MKREQSPYRFDDYKGVNKCSHCEHYYTSACDGKRDSDKCKNLIENTSENAPNDFCKAFTPIREDLFTDEINRLKKRINGLYWNLIAFMGLIILERLVWLLT